MSDVDINFDSQARAALHQWVAGFQASDTRRSLFQLANSLLPYLALMALMLVSLRVSYLLTLLLAIPAAGFMARIFIIFHDCGHGSFFKSQGANALVGYLTGILTFTPYYNWRHDHAVHHATAGDLDRRGRGDVMVLTVQEYIALSPWKRLGYRLIRSPWVMFTVGAWGVFLVGHRFWTPGAGRRERLSVIWTDLALLGILVLASLTVGWQAYLLVQLPITMIGTSVGVWLFYVQHNFSGTYWERHPNWDFIDAALKGSSYYKLPRLLQWFTGNIGFHHVHHLSPRTPNYRLEACHNGNPLLRGVRPLTISASLESLRFRLWDEEHRCLVGFDYLKKSPQT